MRDEKKYEILPGVEIPDIKKIQEAASDFSISEVGDVDIKTVTYEPIESHVTPSVSAEELARLQALGVKVAEDEERSKAESKAKMDKIMKNVQAPESIGDLKASHMAQLDEAKRKQVENDMKEANKQQAQEEAVNKARQGKVMPLSFPRKETAGIQPANLSYNHVASLSSVALLPEKHSTSDSKVRSPISERINRRISAQN